MKQLIDTLNASAADYRSMASGDSYLGGFCIAQALRLESMANTLLVTEMEEPCAGLRITEVSTDEEASHV